MGQIVYLVPLYTQTVLSVILRWDVQIVQLVLRYTIIHNNKEVVESFVLQANTIIRQIPLALIVLLHVRIAPLIRLITKLCA